MDYLERPTRPPHPREKANIFSILSFFYMLPVFTKGWRRPLEENDLYDVLPTYGTKKLGDQMEQEWQHNKTRRSFVSVLKLVLACFGREIFLLGLTDLAGTVVIILIEPFALGKIISYFNPGQTEMTRRDLYIYSGLLVGVNISSSIYNHNYQLWVKGLSFKMRAAFSSLIYRKALKLRLSTIKKASIGKIVTLLGKDVGCLEYFSFILGDVCLFLVKTVIVTYLIYRKIQYAALVGVGFFVVVLPVQIYLSSWAARLRTQMCRKIDDRLQVTQEVLSSIKLIKMYNWQQHFRDKIMTARKEEMRSMHAIFYLKVVVFQIGVLSGNIAFYLLIMTYKWFGNHITAEVLYYVDNLFQFLSYTLGSEFPSSISLAAEMAASIQRVVEFLELPETTELHNCSTSQPKVSLKDVNVVCARGELLRGVNILVGGGLTVVTGPVAGGKTVLLKTILGEYHIVGKAIIQGTISFASQEPWLFPSVIRQNILFGEQYDRVRYHKVLKMCALDYDLNLLPDKDMTVVEDRGINLSKGQQCRINLARAVYKDADIYLLDDCLASLDNNVGSYIFKECIQKFLSDKVVIFVTQNSQYIKAANNVVVVSKGTVSSSVSSPSGGKLHQEEDKNSWGVENNVVSNRIVYQEYKGKGGVNSDSYKQYFFFSGGFLTLTPLLCLYVAVQFVSSYPDKLLSQWVNTEQKIGNLSLYNASTDEVVKLRDDILKVYTAMVLSSAFVGLTAAYVFFRITRRASVHLYRHMISNVIDATMCFFDNTFIGNILNRFSVDFTSIDDHVPFFFNQVCKSILTTIATMILIATVNTFFLIPSVLFMGVLAVTRRYYVKTATNLKRLDLSTRSPVIGHFNASLEGLSTIRAFKAQDTLTKEFDQHQDLYTSAAYLFQCSMKTFAFCLDTLTSIFVMVIIARFVFSDEEYPAGSVGLAISQAFRMTVTLQWGVRMWAELENYMTSVERALEYATVPSEGQQGRVLPPQAIKGEIVYDNVSLSYDNTKNHILKNVSFRISPGEKLGVVGRTGAGKSSIISTLLRLYEPEGTVSIDGVDTKTLSLQCLRSNIAVIPQDPVLFSGTIRDNIDPERHFQDKEVWKAIEAVNLKTVITSLDDNISDGFSLGQKQLVSMARAILRNNKIVVLDEVTASVDDETDAMIQATIREVFSSCTVIIVAHKLHSVLDLDKIVVMEDGRVVEFDTPSKLLRSKSGYFYAMVQGSRR